MTNDSIQYKSTLLIPVNVVWLPYASLVLLVLSWLGYDFFMFHRKNKLKYARMRETSIVESDHIRKRINMISSVGLKYKNGLPDFGTVWNTSPSCSDVSTPSPPPKKFPRSTDISPSDDGCLRMSEDDEGTRTASELSPHAADGVPDDRRRMRVPRNIGSGGGGERSRDEHFGSQSSQGFTAQDFNEDGNIPATLNVSSISKSPHSSRGRRTRDRSGDSWNNEGGGGTDDGGGGGRQRRAAEDDELRFTDMKDQNERNNNNNNNNNNNQKMDECVVGDMSTQTSYTVADLHYNAGRSSPKVTDGAYSHPGVANPRVISISPHGQGQMSPRNLTSSSSHGHSHSSSSSSRSHRRHDNLSTSSPRPRLAASAEEVAAQSTEEFNKPIVIDFSRSQSMKDERCQDSPTNPATPRHQRRHEPRPSVDDYGPPPSERRTKEVLVKEAKEEAVFPGSIWKAPGQDSFRTPETHPRHSHSSSGSSATTKQRSNSSSASKKYQQQPQQQHQHPQQQQQHVSSSSSRHSINIGQYDESSSKLSRSPRDSRERDSRDRDRERDSRDRDRDRDRERDRDKDRDRDRDKDSTSRDRDTSSSSNKKQSDTHFRHPQHLDSRDSRDSISSAREPSAKPSRSAATDSSGQHRESYAKNTSSSSSQRQVKSARQSITSSSATARASSSEQQRRSRKSSDPTRNTSSDSPKIPSHFYNQDEDGFFSSMSSSEHASHSRHDGQHQVPRRGIHFFSQLGSGRRDSSAGFGTRKISAAGGGGFGGDDGDDDYAAGYKGGGFDS